MATLESSEIIVACKNHLQSEWEVYKKTNSVGSKVVCPYAIGGQTDAPVSALCGVAGGVCEWDKYFKIAVDTTVGTDRTLLVSEMMVGGDGHVTFFPERKSKPKTNGTAALPGGIGPPMPGNQMPPSRAVPHHSAGPQTSANHAAPRGKDAHQVRGGVNKVPQTNDMVFVTAVEQIANYMVDHMKRVSHKAMQDGNIKAVYHILGSAILVRSRLNTYREIFNLHDSKNITETLGRCGEVVEICTQNILSYHCDLLHSCLLHDANSSDWNNPKSYQENERFSLSIQMWSFYLQCIRNDLWRYTSPRVAESIMASIFTDSLSLLVTRYAHIQPSEFRLTQYRADIVAILGIVASMLPSLITSPSLLFKVRLHESVALPIHHRANILLNVAALKAAPIECVAKVFQKNFTNQSPQKGPTEIESTPEWLTFLNPTMFPPNTSSLTSLPPDVNIYLTLLTAASRPQPTWHLIIRGMMMSRFKVCKMLMTQMQEMPGHMSRGVPCGGAVCMPHLCSPPLCPQTVYAAIVQLIICCSDCTPLLNQLVSANIRQTSQWDSLDRSQVWNHQRPAWFHAVVQLVTPAIVRVVKKVVASLPAQQSNQQSSFCMPQQANASFNPHHLGAWAMQLLTGVEEVISLVPVCAVQVAHSVNSVVPPTIKPAGGHIISQAVVGALYSVVNSRQSLDQLADAPLSNTQWDIMIAIGERLCSLHETGYQTQLEKITQLLLSRLNEEEGEDEEEEDLLEDYTDEELIQSICTSLANKLLSSVQGQHALQVIWECLKRNMEWIRESLEVPSIFPTQSQPNTDTDGQHLTPVQPYIPPPSQTKPREWFSLPPEPHQMNPLYFWDRIFYTKIDHANLMEFKGDWERVLRGELGLPEDYITKIMKTRPEFEPEAKIQPAQTKAVQSLKVLMK
ncbi:uncharacterized protein LOC143025411 [Oratosquilla oratoria]|uniref:uncharacterized protein LOC143025411 n=1 Tax=Oratosquilla oratoria TaxID=337810 RepID=UPI003F776B99